MPSDRNLIERCLAGDASAFDGIVLRYQDALFRHLLRLAGSREHAEDLCQEALIKFYRALPAFDLGRPVAPFLFRIATNLWRDGRGSPVILLADEDAAAGVDDCPERQAMEAVERHAILEAMQSLRPEYREVLSLRYDQGLSYREIAEVTGVPAGTVATWLHRAVDALRDALALTEQEAVR